VFGKLDGPGCREELMRSESVCSDAGFGAFGNAAWELCV
jgi:hypothetical protein